MRISLIQLPAAPRRTPSLGIAYLAAALTEHEISRSELNLGIKDIAWHQEILKFNLDNNQNKDLGSNLSSIVHQSKRLDSYAQSATKNILKTDPELLAFSVTATPSPMPTRTPIPPTRTPTPYPYQSVVLNEVLPRPGHDWNQDSVVNVDDEFIEIINRGEVSVSLNGWKLDDEYNLGSSPYTLPNIALGPGERIAIFGYTSHISLSDGGDTVRLLKSNGVVADVVTYTIIKAADQSWCRLPEQGFWNPKCFPTPNEENSGLGVFPTFTEEKVRSSCFVPDTAPAEILLVECGLLGMSIYDREFWEQSQSIYWVTGQSKYPTWFR